MCLCMQCMCSEVWIVRGFVCREHAELLSSVTETQREMVSEETGGSLNPSPRDSATSAQATPGIHPHGGAKFQTLLLNVTVIPSSN